MRKKKKKEKKKKKKIVSVLRLQSGVILILLHQGNSMFNNDICFYSVIVRVFV